jgi:predicted TPR repeat methyltransferase
MNDFGEDYFERGLQTGQSAYENYRWIPELTIPLADQIANTCSIDYSDKILDYGCAKGFLVKAFRLLHYEAYGTDISEYALKEAPFDVKPYLYDWDQYPKLYKQQVWTHIGWDWIIAKDVFEHIQFNKLTSLLNILSILTQRMFVIVPLGKNGKYYANTNNLDPSHYICEPLSWWENLFKNHGFEILSSRNKIDHIKQAYNHIHNAHGFLTLKTKSK